MLHQQEAEFRPAAVAGTSAAAQGATLINESNLVRECLHRAFATAGHRVVSYASVDAFSRDVEGDADHGVIVLCVGHRSITDPAVSRDIAQLGSRAPRTPVVVMGDIETYEQITGALQLGARGYIPASTPLDVMAEALNLVRVGGVFLPAAILSAAASGGQTRAAEPGGASHLFTSRQAAVVKALRQGKANKLIAYELNMCESTVKVHVRNIMRKLNAHNRTEVAYRTNGMFPDPETR